VCELSTAVEIKCDNLEDNYGQYGLKEDLKLNK
jgi:hypothetical protein